MASSAPDYTPIYQAAGQEWGVDPVLLAAVAGAEGGGVSNVSPQGAMGHMQIMPGTASDLGVTNPNDVTQSIYGGAKYLSQLLDRYKGQSDPATLAVAAYNAGPGRVDDVLAGKASLPAETAAYVPAVTQRYQALASTGGASASNSATAALDAKMAQLRTAPPQSATPAALPGPDPFAQALGAAGGSTPAAVPAAASDPFAAALAAPSQAVPPPTAQAAPPPQTWAGAAQDALAPAPNTTYGTILPLAKDNVSGDIRLALPSSLRDLASGVVDLVNGPNTGTVTPAATNALTALMTGGAGAGVANALTGSLPRAGSAALRAGTSLLPGRSTYATNALTGSTQLADEATMAQFGQAPFGPTYQPPTGINNLTAAATSPMPPPTTAPPAAAGAIPEALPSRPILPIVTQGQADAQADRIIQHFAGTGPTAANTNALVSGSMPTLAQATGNPGLATLERGFQSANPEPFALRQQANAAARAQALSNVIGTPADIDAAETVRNVTTSAARAQAFANTSPVDPSPVVAQIDSILAGPQGQRPGVAAPLQAIRDALAQTDPQTGAVTLQTDPQQLWGIRQFMNDMISPKAAGTPSDGRMAAAQLGQLKDTLDPIIEQGANGFQKFLQGYNAASQPIDGMRYLQSLNLTDASGNTTLAKLDSAVKTIQRQQAANGNRPGDTVSDSQLQSLQYLRDDMRREANSGLGKSLGSNTMQNFSTNALTASLGHPLMQGISSVGAGYLGGVPGAVAGYVASKGVNALTGRGQRMVQQALTNRLLNPEVGVNALTGSKAP